MKVIEDADKDNYSDTGRDYLNVVEQPRYHETEQINPLPNYKNPNDESFVEIKAKGELYVASFPENEWLFKESAVNDGIDHNTKTLGEIIPSQVDYLEYTEIDESELPQDIAPLSKILNQYIMKDKKPADDDIAHNIAIYALTKEPSHEGY